MKDVIRGLGEGGNDVTIEAEQGVGGYCHAIASYYVRTAFVCMRV